MNVNDSFLVNVTVCEQGSKVEVVMYHGYIREVLNVFDGEKAKEIASLLLTRSTVIPKDPILDEQISIDDVEADNTSFKHKHLLTKSFNFPWTTVYEEDKNNERTRNPGTR